MQKKTFCGSCPFIKEAKEIKHKKGTWKIIKEVNCESINCVYLIECQKENCKQKYIGETKRSIRTRIMEHIGYINNFKHRATGDHFNLPGHGVKDMKYTVLEKVKYLDTAYRKEREKDLIRLFNVYHNAINREHYYTFNQ